jgi:hypothetical protein
MSKIKNIKTVLVIVFIITFIVLVTNGYAGDHFGEYLNDQAPSEYVEATGWRKIVGNIMLFVILFYMGRHIWKSWRN